MMRWVALKAEGSSPAEPAKEEQLGWLSKIDKMFFEVQQKKQSYYDIPELATIKKDVAAYYEDRSCSSWRRRLEVMWTPDEYGLFRHQQKTSASRLMPFKSFNYPTIQQ